MMNKFNEDESDVVFLKELKLTPTSLGLGHFLQ
jgi:hypothetical protein